MRICDQCKEPLKGVLYQFQAFRGTDLIAGKPGETELCSLPCLIAHSRAELDRLEKKGVTR